MRYCSTCVLPDSRPNLVIHDDGVCNACKSSLVKKESIDWAQRERSFRVVIDKVKDRGAEYDCLIPVSGGKDSTWQVVTCLKYGLKPLAVTIRVLGRNELGTKNLDNLVRLGVDHIDYQINPSVEKRFMLGALKKYGATGIPMHMAMHAIPPKIAVRFSVPLIVWGENSAFEYGTTDEALTGFSIDKQWLKQYGNTQGTQAHDWVGIEGLTARDLEAYQMVSSQDLEASSTRAVFLGYYFPWDVETSLKVSLAHGFTVRAQGPKVGLYNYADIDDDFISIHHWVKWYKFGFTRLSDNLSLEIRNGRMTRPQAIDKLRALGAQRPDEDIRKFCEITGITEKYFDEILETFRNHSIWSYEDGVWKIKDFLVPDWRW